MFGEVNSTHIASTYEPSLVCFELAVCQIRGVVSGGDFRGVAKAYSCWYATYLLQGRD